MAEKLTRGVCPACGGGPKQLSCGICHSCRARGVTKRGPGRGQAQAGRPPQVEAAVRDNLARYRERAARGLPLFGE